MNNFLNKPCVFRDGLYYNSVDFICIYSTVHHITIVFNHKINRVKENK